jgi:flagellar basal-body rod protein FlgB
MEIPQVGKPTFHTQRGWDVTAAVDTGLEFFRQVLALRGYRQQLLSADIANASTPGFKGVDLDFRQALGAATTSDGTPSPASSLLLVDDPRQLPAAGGGAPSLAPAAVKYQDGSVSLDGNSIDLDREKTEAAENAVQYEAAATFTSQMVKMLTTAVGASGGQSAAGG